MKRENPEPIVFQIGFNTKSARILASLFDRNGYRARHWLNGTLAEDIMYSKAVGAEPLQAWPRAHFFSGLESVHRIQLPQVEAFREFRFLKESFPDAIFILDKCYPEDLIASRFAIRNGEYAVSQAHRLGVHLTDLPEVWITDWEEHQSQCNEYFQGYEHFFSCETEGQGLDCLIDKLSPWFHFKYRSVEKKTTVQHSQLLELGSIFEGIQPHGVIGQPRHGPNENPRFVQELIDFCSGSISESHLDFDYEQTSGIFAEWDGKDRVVDRDGRRLPFERSSLDGREVFLTPPGMRKMHRIQATINEILSLGQAAPSRYDMQDGRRYGSGENPPPGTPLITYNRRVGAKNMVLWPLPGYHTPGLRDFVHHESWDQLEFDQKSDRCVWRGALSGRPNTVLAPDLSERRPTHMIVKDLESVEPGTDATDHLLEELSGLTRYHVLERLIDNDDFDLGLVQKEPLVSKAAISALGRFVKQKEELQWFFQFKYIISLSGYDTGSNFLVAANSNSVVLKEEDGWEVFYSSCFRPWEHYIPLQRGATDLEQKLDWARRNQDKCREMVRASSAVCSLLANTLIRKSALSAVFENYKARYPAHE